jgi:hypothetical protein
MAIVDSAKRLARLGMWIGVGAVTAIVAACGGKADSSPGPVTPDSGGGDGAGIDVGDAAADVPADASDAAPTDAPTDSPSDAGDAADGDTLWDVPYE